MRIKSVRLKNYKRFTELAIADLPETARLVVLVGPNGTGKSSVFDSFLLKAQAAVSNLRLSGDREEYYEKISQSQSTHEVASRVGIEFHGLGEGEVDWRSMFQVRSAYRNESDFSIAALRATKSEDADPHIARIIDLDKSVSKNYERMVWKRLQDVDRDAPEEVTIGEYRKESLGDLQRAMRGLFSDPDLLLQDFGGIQGGSFRFSKGNVADFHYKTLSGGEKAAFDVLLDVFVKRDEAKEAVFCIDEPELHMATALQGPQEKHVEAFDARCYNRLFADEFPDTLFISQGGSGEVIQSEHLVAILKAIASGIEVEKLIDRDDMTAEERSRKIAQGIRVLRRRELEEYLYDPEVLRTFLHTVGKESVVGQVLSERESLVNGQPGPTNIKDVSRQLFTEIRNATGLANLGNNREQFAAQFLLPALRETHMVYEELREDVFG